MDKVYYYCHFNEKCRLICTTTCLQKRNNSSAISNVTRQYQSFVVAFRSATNSKRSCEVFEALQYHPALKLIKNKKIPNSILPLHAVRPFIVACTIFIIFLFLFLTMRSVNLD